VKPARFVFYRNDVLLLFFVLLDNVMHVLDFLARLRIVAGPDMLLKEFDTVRTGGLNASPALFTVRVMTETKPRTN
jgi:hypothetical protein